MTEDQLKPWDPNRCDGIKFRCQFALVLEVGYHLRTKKIDVIRVVFQDQAMYARTSFGGLKTCKIGKKSVFLVIVRNFGKDMMDKLRIKHAKTRI